MIAAPPPAEWRLDANKHSTNLRGFKIMKIRIDGGEIVDVSIQLAKGNVVMLSERIERGEAPGRAAFNGKVVLATEYELDLLRKTGRPDIRIPEGFMPTDKYKGLDKPAKAAFWRGVTALVIIYNLSEDSLELPGGRVLTVEAALILYHSALP
jgi:hypothetical protein